MKLACNKYLGIHTDKNFILNHHRNNLAKKLYEANAMLSKIIPYVDIKTLKSIEYFIFESHLSYAPLVWVQNSSSVKRLHILQNFKF